MPRALQALVLLIVLVLPSAPVLAEPEVSDGRPIVLTSEDIERVKAKQKSGDADDSSLIIVPTPEPPRANAPAWPRQHRPGDEPLDFDTPATSWQEEYYRLKAVALKQAMERGDPIFFGEPAAPASPPDEESHASRVTSGAGRRACIYARDGELVYAPPGQSCRD